MSLKKTAGKVCLWLGVVLLATTVTLHLLLGLPPLEAGIANGFITKAPGMSPPELVGIWVAFSVMFYVGLAGVVLDQLMNTRPSTLFAASIGFAAVCCGATMYTVVPGVHISVSQLTVPGTLMVAGALLRGKKLAT